MSADELIDTPPSRQGKSLTGFYIAIGVVGALIGLGTWFYKPLLTRYAIYKVRHATWDTFGEPRVDMEYGRWVCECAEAACRGNTLDMEAIIDASGFGDDALGEVTCEIAYEVAAAQPAAFFKVLGRRPDARGIQVLSDITAVCAKERPNNYDWAGVSLQEVVSELKLCSESPDLEPEFRRTAAATLTFTRLRFAKELAEAEKVGEPPK